MSFAFDFFNTDPNFRDPTLPHPVASPTARQSHSPKPKRDAPSAPAIIALAFSKSPLSISQWSSLITQAVLTLQEELGLPRTQQYTTTRYLDLDEQTSQAKVAEVLIPMVTKSGSAAKKPKLGGPISLAECTKCCNSRSMQSLQAVRKIELILQPSELYLLHQQPGLAVFDMDSTLIQQEVIDELARAIGLYPQVAAITEAAMRGEAPYTDFEASLRARVGLLRGVPTSIWEQLKARVITFTPGAAELVRVLKRLGWKTAVLSGGFTPLAEWVKETLGLDYAYANYLDFDSQQSVLTGFLVEGMPIIHAEKKRELLLHLAAENNIPPERTIAVGDGSNDLLMMGASGLGIAFNAKPKVQQAAPARINSDGLLDVLYLLGHDKKVAEGILAKETIMEGGRFVLRNDVPVLPAQNIA